MIPGQDHHHPIGPARPIAYPSDERLVELIQRSDRCPVCNLPTEPEVLPPLETAHAVCRARNAGKWTVIEKREARSAKHRS